jgi:cytochrome c oxidase assembly protein subunit 15
MRHYQAGLAIPDLPLAYGNVLPPVSADGLARANEFLTWDAHLPRVTLGQVWLHFGHRVGALLVTTAAVALVVRVFRERRREQVVPSLVLCALLLAQVTLGVLTVLWRKPADVASAHVAVGALVLVTSFVMTVRAARVNWLAVRVAPALSRHAGASAAPPRIGSSDDLDRPEETRGGAELAPA